MNWLCNLLGNTAFLTVITGTLVFVLGQFFLEFVLRPIRKYKELKAEVAFCLRLYRAKFINCVLDEPAQKAAKELAAKLLCDKAFYDQSGGGVTYSGGEAALQADFFLEATETLKVESIHIALDTSGHVPWDKLEPLVKAVDLVLYDIKTIDSEIHRRYTGADNLLVLNNAQNIAQMQKEMIIRLLMVPGVNDGEKDIEDRLRFIRDLGNVSRVDVLKYHRLGSGKYKRLGLNEPMGDTPVCSDESAGNIERKASDMGLNVTIGS